MALDPYAPCHCGSGKKFKWCCQPIYAGIQHAWELENSKQHEAAARIMEQVVAEHGGNPEAWGQQALLFIQHEKVDEAEAALEKAFALNPNYPFGLRIRAQMRLAEGEIKGALLLARKAVETYDPEAHDALGELHALIFDCEMRLQHPVAARAALERATHLLPAQEEFRGHLENLFGPEGRFPNCAAKRYTFRKPIDSLQGERRQAWNRALNSATARLGDLANIFDSLTKQDEQDAAAWFNLGLVRAWLGENAAAITALDRYVDLETNEEAAIEASALIETLRLGVEMVDDCDYHEYMLTLKIANPQPVQALLQEWMNQDRLIPLQAPQENVFMAMVLETSSSGLITAGRPAASVGRVAGYIFIVANMLRFSGPVKERVDRIKDELRTRLSLGLTDIRESMTPSNFGELLTEAIAYPLADMDDESRVKAIGEHAIRFFEDTWIHRPLRSLNNIAPIDAAGHPRLRKKLLGVLRLLEEGATKGVLNKLSFDSLRHKLGLSGKGLASSSEASSSSVDVSSMNAADLAGLKADSLSDEQLEKAYQTAYRLDAQELAENFAVTLVARPVQPERPDRFPWYSFLIQKAIRDGAFDAAMDRVNDGEKADCEHNGGKRRNDFELFRAQVHAKRGEVSEAQDVYQRLIERTPRDFKVRGKAAEAMLGLKDPARALTFAEDGIKAARQANDRDNEQYLMELAAAAKRQLGA